MKFKKIICLLLVLALAISLITSAYAQETAQNENASIPIQNKQISEISQSEPVSENIQQLINQLNNSKPGKLPDGFTKEDMQLVFREGGQAGLDAINNIIKNAPPIETLSSYEMSPVDTYESNDNYRENYSYQYDPSTGQTSFIDGSEFDHPSASATNSSYTFNNSTRSLMPRAYPNYWFEYNPQNYFDTRSTCKLTIMLKDGSYGYGSGFMIGPNHIATAGHCIYIKEENSNTAEWCDYIVVTPANRSAYPSQPYGMAFSQTVEVGGYWYNSFDSTDDWGVAELDTSFDTGYLNLSAPIGDIWGWWVRGQGYPGDLQDMYLIGGNIINNTEYHFVFNNTSEPGMSGGSVLDGDQNIIGFITAHDTSNGNAIVLRLRDWHVNKFMSYR